MKNDRRTALFVVHAPREIDRSNVSRCIRSTRPKIMFESTRVRDGVTYDILKKLANVLINTGDSVRV